MNSLKQSEDVSFSPLTAPDRLRALHRSALLFGQPEATFDRVTRLARRALSVSAVLMTIVGPKRQRIKSVADRNDEADAFTDLPLSHSICRFVVERGDSLRIDDTRSEGLVCDNPIVREHGVAAYLGVPLYSVEGEVLGSVCAVDMEPRRWTDEDEDTLRDCADLVTQELRRRRMRWQLQRQGHLMRGVADALSLLLDDDLDASAEDAFAALGLTTGVDRVYLFECVEGAEAGRMVVSQRYEWARDTVGAEIDNPELQNLDLGAAGMQRWVDTFRARLPIRGPVQSFPESERAILEAQNIESLLVLPIVLEGRLWGFMGFDDCRYARTWSGADRATLALAAAGAGEAIARSNQRRALVVSEERYRYALNTVHDVVFRLGLDGFWTFLSPAWHRLTGFTIEESLPRNAFDIVHPDDIAKAGQHFGRLVDGEVAVCTNELRYLTAYGPRWMQVVATTLRDETGAVTGLTGVVRDIHDRKEAEHRLRDSEERLRLAMDATRMGAWDVNLREQTASWSPQLLALFEVDPSDEVRYVPALYHLVYEPDRQKLAEANRAAYDTARATGEPVSFETEFRVMRSDGVHWFRSFGRIYTDEDGPTRGSGTVVDITEEWAAREALIAAKEEAEDLAQLKTTFVNTISHEIRTPLAAIMGFADVLAEEVANDDLGEMVGLIQDGAQRLHRTLNAVLDLASLEGDAVVLHPERLDLANEVRGCARLLESQATDKALTLEVDAAASPVWAWADANAVQRIVLNLLSNAVKFTDTGAIRVGVAYAADAVVLTVQDSGIGMDAEFLAHAFEPFRRARHGAAQRAGTGLGLAIVQHLVDLMEGRIEVTSTPGEGTMFTVTLPAATEEGTEGR